MPTTPSPRRLSAAETWVPTNPAAPVTSTDMPPLPERTRAEVRTRFSQVGPPQLLVPRARRVGSSDLDEEGDRKKTERKIKPKKTKAQTVTFVSEKL